MPQQSEKLCQPKPPMSHKAEHGLIAFLSELGPDLGEAAARALTVFASDFQDGFGSSMHAALSRYRREAEQRARREAGRNLGRPYWVVRGGVAYLHLEGVGDLVWGKTPEISNLPDGLLPQEHVARLEYPGALSGPVGEGHVLAEQYRSGIL